MRGDRKHASPLFATSDVLLGGVMVLILMLCACIANGAQSTADMPVSVKQKKASLHAVLGDQADKVKPDKEYIVGYGDILSVSIYEEGSMAVGGASRSEGSGNAVEADSGVKVMMDGRISLKNIGDVEVVGLTLTELADYLKKLYSKIYDNPIVTTALIESNSLKYTVMGEVKNPGVYKLDSSLSIMQVVAKSGGFTDWAGKEITIVRKDLTESDQNLFKKNTLKFDYDDFISGKDIERNIDIRSGDIVIVK